MHPNHNSFSHPPNVPTTPFNEISVRIYARDLIEYLRTILLTSFSEIPSKRGTRFQVKHSVPFFTSDELMRRMASLMAQHAPFLHVLCGVPSVHTEKLSEAVLALCLMNLYFLLLLLVLTQPTQVPDWLNRVGPTLARWIALGTDQHPLFYAVLAKTLQHLGPPQLTVFLQQCLLASPHFFTDLARALPFIHLWHAVDPPTTFSLPLPAQLTPDTRAPAALATLCLIHTAAPASWFRYMRRRNTVHALERLLPQLVAQQDPVIDACLIYSLPFLPRTDLHEVLHTDGLTHFILTFLFNHPLGLNPKETGTDDPIFKLFAPLFRVLCITLAGPKPRTPLWLDGVLDHVTQFLATWQAQWDKASAARRVRVVYLVVSLHACVARHFATPCVRRRTVLAQHLQWVHGLHAPFPSYRAAWADAQPARDADAPVMLAALWQTAHTRAARRFVYLFARPWVPKLPSDALLCVLAPAQAPEPSPAYHAFCAAAVYHHADLGLWPYYLAQFLPSQFPTLRAVLLAIAPTLDPAALRFLLALLEQHRSADALREDACLLWTRVPLALMSTLEKYIMGNPSACLRIFEEYGVPWDRKERLVRRWNAMVLRPSGGEDFREIE